MDTPHRYSPPPVLSSCSVHSTSLTREKKLHNFNLHGITLFDCLLLCVVQMCFHMVYGTHLTCWINIKSAYLTLQSSIVPGIKTHSSSNTPSAVMMLFFTLSLRFKVFCKGSNKKECLNPWHFYFFRIDKSTSLQLDQPDHGLLSWDFREKFNWKKKKGADTFTSSDNKSCLCKES